MKKKRKNGKRKRKKKNGKKQMTTGKKIRSRRNITRSEKIMGKKKGRKQSKGKVKK